MKKPLIIYTLLAMTLSLGWFVGCDSEKGTITDSGGTVDENPQIVSIDPPHEAQNVSTSSSIAIVFDQPMDIDSVTEAFHFTWGDSMHAWMDSLGHHDGPGHMGHMDHMNDWLDDISHHGEFHWNDLHDSCAFFPDSLMRPNTEYMFMLRGAVQGHHGMFMDFDNYENEAFTHRFHTGQ
jgi:Bacterial Ig-like domain